MVDAADVILEVLDARNPLGCRSQEVEQAVMAAGPRKKLVLVLNKIDLVPREVVEDWLKCVCLPPLPPLPPNPRSPYACRPPLGRPKGHQFCLVGPAWREVPGEAPSGARSPRPSSWPTGSRYLRNEYPTVAFKAATQSQRSHIGHSRGEAVGGDSGSAAQGADVLLRLFGNYCRSQDIRTSIRVGIVGYPNVGKSSIINSLSKPWRGVAWLAMRTASSV